MAKLAKGKSRSKGKNKRKAYSCDRPLNCYNLFYHLERELLHQTSSNGRGTNTSTSKLVNFRDYADLPAKFPSIPARYQELVLAEDWFMKGKRRVRNKKAGLMKLGDMSNLIGQLWKGTTPEIRSYVTEVATMVKNRRDAIKQQMMVRRESSPAAAVLNESINTSRATPNESLEANRGVPPPAPTQVDLQQHNMHDIMAALNRISAKVAEEMINQWAYGQLSYTPTNNSPSIMNEVACPAEEDNNFNDNDNWANQLLREPLQSPPPSPFNSRNPSEEEKCDLFNAWATAADQNVMHASKFPSFMNEVACPAEEDEYLNDNWANQLLREPPQSPPPFPFNNGNPSEEENDDLVDAWSVVARNILECLQADI